MSELAIGMVDIEKKARAEMMPLMERAEAFKVVDERSYLDADAIATDIKAKVKEREKELLPGKELATKTWKYHVALCKKYIDDPLEAIKLLDRKRYAWKKEEERKRAEEAERARLKAAAEAREAQHIEAQRIAAEAKAKADEALATAERLRKANMVEQAEEVLSAAGLEETKGIQQAQAVMDAPVHVTVPEPVKIAKPEGQANVENWQFRIVGPVPVDYMTPDLVKIGKAVKLMKGETRIQGVEVFDVGSVRRGR